MKKTKERKGEITDEELEDALQGDIPDEFACALSFCVRYAVSIMNYLTLQYLKLLNDPVKLPSSGQHVERHMIKKALLDNEMDPFNR